MGGVGRRGGYTSEGGNQQQENVSRLQIANYIFVNKVESFRL